MLQYLIVYVLLSGLWLNFLMLQKLFHLLSQMILRKKFKKASKPVASVSAPAADAVKADQLFNSFMSSLGGDLDVKS